MDGRPKRRDGSKAWVERTGSCAVCVACVGLGKPSMTDGYANADDCLSAALNVALEKGLKGRCVRDLVMRRAGIWERMGSTESLVRAKNTWVDVWRAMEEKGEDEERARIAVKIGDVAKRLDNESEALYWWDWAVENLSGVKRGATDTSNGRLPQSPFAQRTLVSALLALSAHFATTNQFKFAEVVECTGLRLFNTSASLDAVGLQSPAQNLHTLFLQHRLALLKIHLVVVTYALNRPSSAQLKPKSSSSWFSKRTPEPEATVTPFAASSIDILSSARETTARVIHLLSAPHLTLPPPPSPTRHLHSYFHGSRNIRTPAMRLLRDARRGTVEALVLEGILLEGDRDVKKAVERFAEAGAWVGKDTSKDPKRHDVGEEERRRVWAHWERAKVKLDANPSSRIRYLVL